MPDKPQCTQYYIYDRRTQGSIRCTKPAWKDGICKIHHPENRLALEKGKDQRARKRRRLELLSQAERAKNPDMADARRAVGLYTLEEAKAYLKGNPDA